jgi:ribonuclease D
MSSDVRGGVAVFGSMPPAPDVAFALCADPVEFRRLAEEWSRCPELWIDTETADWWTPSPRLSLLQVRTPEGRIQVVDILAPGNREVVDTVFVPAVMANPAVRKWAHSAGYERRFLGGPLVQNLQCTLRLARSIPYYRLPVRRLTLAALCGQLLDVTLDKAHQKDDWGVRPLSDAQLAYAAADPEWCRRVQVALEPLVRHFVPADEDPVALRAEFLDVSARTREREARRGDLRDAVRDWLLGESSTALGGFRLYRRATARTTLGELVRVAAELDPGHTLVFETPVHRKVSDTWAPHEVALVRDQSAIRTTRAFYCPRVPGTEPRMVYGVARGDDERIDREYAVIEEELHRLRSEKDELKGRLKAWLEVSGHSEWGGFRFSDPRERWTLDMRTLVDLVPAARAIAVGVPAQFRLAFGGGVLDRLQLTLSETAFVTWRERLATHLDPEASQSRDWHEPAEAEAE